MTIVQGQEVKGQGYDSDFLVTSGTESDVACKGGGGAAKRARLSRSDRVDESVVAPSSIPIIISSPDDCDNQLASGNKSSELMSAPRRLSCPLPVYDVTRADCKEKTSSGPRDSSTSRKRRHGFALSLTSHRRPSLQSITVEASCGAVQMRDGNVRRTAKTRVDGKCQSSSLDVHWSARRLSLPHSSMSLNDGRLTDRLQLPAAVP